MEGFVTNMDLYSFLKNHAGFFEPNKLGEHLQSITCSKFTDEEQKKLQLFCESYVCDLRKKRMGHCLFMKTYQQWLEADIDWPEFIQEKNCEKGKLLTSGIENKGIPSLEMDKSTPTCIGGQQEKLVKKDIQSTLNIYNKDISTLQSEKVEQSTSTLVEEQQQKNITNTKIGKPSMLTIKSNETLTFQSTPMDQSGSSFIKNNGQQCKLTAKYKPSTSKDTLTLHSDNEYKSTNIMNTQPTRELSPEKKKKRKEPLHSNENDGLKLAIAHAFGDEKVACIIKHLTEHPEEVKMIMDFINGNPEYEMSIEKAFNLIKTARLKNWQYETLRHTIENSGTYIYPPYRIIRVAMKEQGNRKE